MSGPPRALRRCDPHGDPRRVRAAAGEEAVTACRAPVRRRPPRPLLVRARRRRGRGARRRRRRALRRPAARAAPARGGPGRRRPVAPRGRHRHRARPADVAALDHHPAPHRAARRAPRARRSSCRPRATSSTPCTSSTTATTTWITVEPGHRDRRSSPGSTRCGSCSASRSPTSPTTAPCSASRSAAESAPGEPLAWRRPVARTSSVTPPHTDRSTDHPGAGAALARAASCRARDLGRGVGDRPLAGTWAAEALRVAAWRPRLGLETDHRTIAARGRLAAHRRAPAQGLLPRAGDRRPGAQPRPAAAPARLPAPRRLRATCCPTRGAEVVLGGRDGRVGSRRWRGTTRTGPSRSPLVKRNTPSTRPARRRRRARPKTVVVTPLTPQIADALALP